MQGTCSTIFSAEQLEAKWDTSCFSPEKGVLEVGTQHFFCTCSAQKNSRAAKPIAHYH